LRRRGGLGCGRRGRDHAVGAQPFQRRAPRRGGSGDRDRARLRSKHGLQVRSSPLVQPRARAARAAAVPRDARCGRGGMALALKLSRRSVAFIAVAALVLGYWAFLRIAGPKVEVSRAVRRDVVQTVVATGRVATPYRVEIGAQVVGTVAEVPVEQGQSVKAGQTLILLESSEARAAVKQAEVAVAQAEARLRQLRELQLPVADQALRQAQANLDNAKVQYERNKKLYEAGFIGKAA